MEGLFLHLLHFPGVGLTAFSVVQGPVEILAEKQKVVGHGGADDEA